MPISNQKAVAPHYGKAISLRPLIQRVTAPNPSPFTYKGTNTYIIGQKTLAVIDPGPDNDSHLNTLLKAINGRPVSHIFVTHCHRDHSPLAKRLAAKSGALIVAEGPYRQSLPHLDLQKGLSESVEADFQPDIALPDNSIIGNDEWRIRCITTPGHMANHASFSLEGHGVIFTGDHVMGWATTVVAPPDGCMHDYLTSLDKLAVHIQSDQCYFPAHGGYVDNPQKLIRTIKARLKSREEAILYQLQHGNHTIAAITTALYRHIDPGLYKGAKLLVFSHLIDLTERKVVVCEGTLALSATYRFVGY